MFFKSRSHWCGRRHLIEVLEPRLLLSSHRHHSGQVAAASAQPSLAPPVLDIITCTNANDSITLTKDGDGQHIDWSLNSGAANWVSIGDPNGLAINCNGGADRTPICGAAVEGPIYVLPVAVFGEGNRII